ncbi:TMEM175 family protein [Ferruginibacter sp.]
MGKNRLEAFSDGVIAIIITIMVLELKVPHGDHLSDLKPLLPVFFSYVLSFTNVAIYWNNHHHMLHSVSKISGSVLWANVHLLFWLSLFPFTTAWMGENHFATWPVVSYGVVSTGAGVAYFILVKCLINANGKDSALAQAFGKDRKGLVSILLNIPGIAFAFIYPSIGLAFYVLIAAIWLVPDRRIEKK